MKNIIIGLLLLFCALNLVNAQAIYETIESSKLGETREIKIQLPRGYKSSEDKRYPLFIVLDGDYLFEPVAGNVDYFSYWEDMPESIVVGINQLDKRFDDCLYSEENSLPVETGAAFFEFIGMELIPYIEKTYRTTNFRVAIGHGESANFINYYLLKPVPLFQAYVVMSPNLAPNMLDYIQERISNLESKIFYYLIDTNKDASSIKDMTEALNAEFTGMEIKNDKVIYNYDRLEGISHYLAPTYALPKAIESVFKIFQPISREEYKETILQLDSSPVDYLLNKYESIDKLFGVKKEVIINDFKAISAAIEKTEKFEYYEALGNMARDSYPETLLGTYYLARFYEETGKPKRAMRTYQSAFILEEIAGLTKDMMLEKADLIKEDFGY